MLIYIYVWCINLHVLSFGVVLKRGGGCAMDSFQAFKVIQGLHGGCI